MPKDILKEEVKIGEIQYEWAVKEYEEQDRSERWYWLAAILGIIFIVYSIFSANYLFALVTVLFGIILFMHDMVAPMDVYFAITNTGIIIGKKFYRYSEFSGFWVIYNPPFTKNLYLSRNSLLHHRIQIPLYDFDPRPVRDYLSKYLDEDLSQEDEPLSDRLGRIMKI